MPSAIAIRMYWVNLLDISYPLNSSAGEFGRFRAWRNTHCKPSNTTSPMCPSRNVSLYETRARSYEGGRFVRVQAAFWYRLLRIQIPFRRSNEANPESPKLLSLSDK